MSAPDALEVVSHSADETRRLGRLLGRELVAGDVVLLEGGLGAGKTVFAQGIGVGLDVAEAVTSPTFVLIEEHRGRVPFYHADLYRLSGEADVATTGLEEYLGGDGVAAVEWADRAAGLLPPDRLVVELRPEGGAERRRLRIVGTGPRHRGRVAALAAAIRAEGADG